MKNKMIYSTIAVLFSLAFFNACNEDIDGATYNPEKGKDYVSFQAGAYSFRVDDETMEVNIYAGHANKNMKETMVEIATVEYEEGTEDLFNISSTRIPFGENAWIPIEIAFEPSTLEYTRNYWIKIVLTDDESPYPLGTDIKETLVTIKRELTFFEFGEGFFVSEAWESEWIQPILLAQQAEVYRLPDLYEEGYSIDIFVKENGEIVLDPQPAWFYDNDYGDVYIKGTGFKEGNALTMEIEHYLPDTSNSFGVFLESLTLPADNFGSKYPY